MNYIDNQTIKCECGKLIYMGITTKNDSELCTCKTNKIMEKRVLVRANAAGVHFGELVSRNGQEVHLKNARRLWSWNGALSLSEVAMKGIDLKNSKISERVDEIIIPTAIEIITISNQSNLPCN